MSLDHSKATATLLVTGLALCCYNRKTSNWEVGFLRQSEHCLSVSVIKHTPDGDATTKFKLDTRHRIFVDAANAISPTQPLFTEDKAFSRAEDSTNDHEDLRWVVDLENDLNSGKPVVLFKPDFPVTRMYVSQPQLYADSNLRQDPLKLVKAADEESTVRSFGKVSEGVKADITCQAGGAVILRIDGPLGFSINLPHIDGQTHTIVVDNTCPKPVPVAGAVVAEKPSDFKVFYSMVKDTDGDQFNLRDIGSEAGAGQGAVCNPGTLGQSESLFSSLDS